jgi:hypothetical protein
VATALLQATTTSQNRKTTPVPLHRRPLSRSRVSCVAHTFPIRSITLPSDGRGGRPCPRDAAPLPLPVAVPGRYQGRSRHAPPHRRPPGTRAGAIGKEEAIGRGIPEGGGGMIHHKRVIWKRRICHDTREESSCAAVDRWCVRCCGAARAWGARCWRRRWGAARRA